MEQRARVRVRSTVRTTAVRARTARREQAPRVGSIVAVVVVLVQEEALLVVEALGAVGRMVVRVFGAHRREHTREAFPPAATTAERARQQFVEAAVSLRLLSTHYNLRISFLVRVQPSVVLHRMSSLVSWNRREVLLGRVMGWRL